LAAQHPVGPARPISSEVVAGVLEVCGQCPRDSHGLTSPTTVSVPTSPRAIHVISASSWPVR
jgi:hypothetical protein